MKGWSLFTQSDVAALGKHNPQNYYGLDTEGHINSGRISFVILSSLNGLVYILSNDGNDFSSSLLNFLGCEYTWIGVDTAHDFVKIGVEMMGHVIDTSGAVSKLESLGHIPPDTKSGLGYQCFLLYGFDYKPMSDKRYLKRYGCHKPKHLFWNVHGYKYPSFPPDLYQWNFNKYRNEILNYLAADVRVPIIFFWLGLVSGLQKEGDKKYEAYIKQ